ncbi:hypothetical protein FPV67DRAFT_1414813 [Lyophyllum atratum]|nr:hypothetical protein FPV67DRAFT_1414813 [Lyophyllum atratum]
MPSQDVDNGLLFVYGECGPDVTEGDFNDWYDNEHAPARLTVPGISTAIRYKATDGKPPSWLATYDVTTPDVLQSDAYRSLGVNASANEKSIISRLATLHRGIYNRIATVQNPDVGATALPSKFTLVVGMAPSPDKEEDFNKWYEEEHLGLMSKVPGFIRARRYKLVSEVELAGKADPTSLAVAFPYVALYDWESDAYTKEPSFTEAISTPWSAKVLAEVPRLELRLFALHRDFSK